ncbi:formylglycine-generating enzyme family protein [Promineifilum sp.]|uniref:formylglycine-generating enzyme family protein n=1 Tax=Promineifilum sp. TaxID=2664178 RepID=UPI0035B48E76
MSIDRSARPDSSEPAFTRQPVRCGAATVATLIILSILVLSLSACTRDEAAAALSAAAVELKATLEPWGATARANAAALGERLPAALATAKAPVPTPGASPTAELPAGVTMVVTIPPLDATPSAPPTTPTRDKNPVPPATAPSSPTPLPTRTPLPTATATAAPPPAQLDVVLPAESGSSGGTMTLLPGGSFQMGASVADSMALCATFRRNCQEAWFAASEPAHLVTLAPFYMDSHEVTNEVFALFLNETGGAAALCLGYPCLNTDEIQIVMADGVYVVGGGLERRPAAGVTWYGAAAFCEWRGARLPTEAEWEMAAGWDGGRGGFETRPYPWGDAFDGKALNFCDANCQAEHANLAYNDGYAATAPVASYEAGRSPAGLYDMAGNVWEWVADWYDPTYYAASPAENPTGPLTGEDRVVRGGSWYDTGYFTTVAVRFPSAPDNADKTLGFRCAADLP